MPQDLDEIVKDVNPALATKELTAADILPFTLWNYSIQDLVNFEMLSFKKAEEIVSTPDFIEGFNDNLRTAFYNWGRCLFYTGNLTSEDFNEEYQNWSLAVVNAIGAYIRDRIRERKTPEQAAPEIANLLRQAARLRQAYDAKSNYAELTLLAENAALVFKQCQDMVTKGFQFPTIDCCRGQIILSTYDVSNDLIAKLRQANVQVSEDKRAVFGDNFSRLVEYNTAIAALKQPLLTEEDGVSSELRKAMHVLKQSLFYPKIQSTVSAVGVYMEDQLKAGKTPEQAAPEIANLLRQAARLRQANGAESNYTELTLLAENAALVFKVYTRAQELLNQFRTQYRDQIALLADFYSNERWNDQTRGNTNRMKQFLRGN